MPDALNLTPSTPRTPRPPAAPVARAATASGRPTFGVDALATAPVPTAPTQAPPDLTGLTAEEVKFVGEGFLPANFAALREAQREGGLKAAQALARKGLKGPFSRRFGNPDEMLHAARRWEKNPELARLVKSVQPGDIMVYTWNKDNDVISKATKGPFIHAALCVSAGAPPEFIEAIGLTGDMGDPAGNKVLRSQMFEHGHDGETIRVLRPAANMTPMEAEKAVRRAIAYAERQLGKPYDFAFTEHNGKGWNDAFYCSELAYKAYTDPKGADLPLPIDKSPERDIATSAMAKLIEGLRPDDPGALTFKAAQLSADKGMTTDKLVGFIAKEILPATAATRKIADTPERRAAVEASLKLVIEGKAFSGFQRELRELTADDQKGRHAGIGGFIRRVKNITQLTWAGVQDARAITKGVGFWRSIGTCWRVAQAVGPHLDVLTGFFFGPDDPRTRSASKTLDNLDALARDARRWPLIGRFWPVPSRPRLENTRDFVSPTDLGWADLPHWDYNVKPSFPIDKPAVEAKKPPYQR